MQIVEHTQDRLVLSLHRSFVKSLFIGISFALGGFFFCLVGLLLIHQTEKTGILPFGIGCTLIVAGVFWVIKYPKKITVTFDKSRNCILWEHHTVPSQPVKQSLELPIHLIAGVEIATAGDAETTSYIPKLILDRIYWRIHLDSDGCNETAAMIAKTVSQFLKVNYFPNESKAPLPIWEQKLLDGAAPYQFGWKYLEEEVERLQQHLSQYPLDAEAHQELGILLRSNRKESTVHLKQAENLFEAQNELDRAILARVLQDLVNYNH
jgi:hypothetical protein